MQDKCQLEAPKLKFLTKRSVIRKPVLHLVLIALAACLAYANSLSVPFIFDDHVIIENNLFIQDARFLANPSLVKGSYLYYPLKLRYVSLLSFALDFRFYGLDPWGYHLTNLIIHLLNAFLVRQAGLKSL